MTKLRVGLIGLGEVAQLVHLPILNRLQDFYEIRAVHDLSPSVMSQVATRWGIIRLYDSASALTNDQEIDAVFVLSPDQHHREHVEIALKKGKHVFVEKPACLVRADVEQLANLSTATSRAVMVGYMRRFAPAFQEAKLLVSMLGQITYVRAMDFFCEGPWFFRQTNDVVYPNQDISKEIVLASRRLRLEMMQRICGDDASEGLIRAYDYLTGISCHSISAMRELLGGSPRRIVSAHISPSGNQLTVIFDYADFNVVYEYLIDDNARFEAGFDVYSRDKMLRLRYDTPYIRNLPMVVELQESSRSDSKRVTHGPFYKDSFENELETFHAVITRGVPNKTSLSDSLADFLIFEEIVGHLAMNEKKHRGYI